MAEYESAKTKDSEEEYQELGSSFVFRWCPTWELGNERCEGELPDDTRYSRFGTFEGEYLDDDARLFELGLAERETRESSAQPEAAELVLPDRTVQPSTAHGFRGRVSDLKDQMLNLSLQR